MKRGFGFNPRPVGHPECENSTNQNTPHWKSMHVSLIDKKEREQLGTNVDGMTTLSRRIRLVLWLFIATISLESLATASSSSSPTEVIKSTIDDVTRLLSDEKYKTPDQLKKRRQMIEDIIGRHFDYEEMAKRSLAAYWKKLNQEERQEFVKLFTSFLSWNYAGKIEGYAGEQVHYLNERIKGNFAEVRTKIVSVKTELPLNYRLLKKSGDWYVYNIVIEGVSLIRNYRTQFKRIIRDSSYAELVQQLRNKSEEIHAP